MLRQPAHGAAPRYRYQGFALGIASLAVVAGVQAAPPDTLSATVPALPERELRAVEVRATATEVRTYDRNGMDASPTSDRDIAALIAHHPAVQIDRALAGNGNHGSLAPDAFTIHGESPYQNQFLIDGISATNAIRPQESQTGLQVGRVPGYAQAYNLDTDLLDTVRVHDSMVPVEFGRFQGGVVDAKIKTPQGSNRFSIQRSYNSSELTQQKMPPGLQGDWAAGEPGFSSVWKKHFTSLHGDIRLTQDTTALLAFSRRESRIERQARVLDNRLDRPNGKRSVLQVNDETDQVDNLLAKLHTQWGGGTESSLLFKYADRQEDLVSNAFANSAWTNRQKSIGLGFDIRHLLDSGKLSATLGVDQLDALRDADSAAFVVQQFADKSLSSYSYGAFGRESFEQRQHTAKLRMDWNAMRWGAVQHKIYAGLEWQATDARFVRAQDSISANQTLLADGTQFVNTRNRYQAGSAEIDYQSLAMYLSHAMQWRNWGVLISARADHDQLLHNTHLAPRTRLDWDAFGDGRTQLRLGWARYYGIDMLDHALDEEKSRLMTTEIRNGRLVNTPTAGQSHDATGLQTPYSDEWALAWEQQITPTFAAGASYVRRASKDALTQTGTAGAGYRYTNGGWGENETVALNLRTTRPWQALGAAWNARVDFSWRDSWRNYNSSLGSEAGANRPDDVVEINGLKTQRKHLVGGFLQPRKLSAGFSGRWPQIGLTWGNRLEWNSPMTSMAYLGTAKSIERYASQRLASHWTWDTSLRYQPAQFKGLTLALNVLNVLNSIEPLAIGSPNAANNVRYKTGREIWLNAGYQF